MLESSERAELADEPNERKRLLTFVIVGGGPTGVEVAGAIGEMSGWRFAGFAWLVVHIFFLTGFRRRLFVVLSWAWSFFTFRRGARLIVKKDWRSYG